MTRDTQSSQAFDHVFIKFAGLLRRRGRVERRALAPTHITVKRELRDQQHAAVYFCYREVHLAGGILKNTQSRDLVGKIVSGGFRVNAGDAQQHQQPLSNLAGNLVIHSDAGAAHALYDGAHGY